MKKGIYILILIAFAIIIAGSAFIPLDKDYKEENENWDVDLAEVHPEAGYIEEIGN